MARKIPTRIGLKNRKSKQRRRKIGKAPGTITYLGERSGGVSSIELLTYNQEEYRKEQLTRPEMLENIPTSTTELVNVVGLSDEALMTRLGELANLNALTVEDIVNTDQRPKVDEYEAYIFGVFKMLYLSEDRRIIKEHVALVLQEKRVFVFQEIAEDVFDGVRQRIEAHSGRIRSRGADYLFFALLDALVDNYFLVLEVTEEKLDALEDEIYLKPNSHTAFKIQQLRKEIISLRGWMAPVRDLIARLIESDSPLITKDTRLFLRDALDHANEIHETLQLQREMAFSLMDMYMSSVSNRMNEVMKVLTIMASIFIPLTFIAGIYGMNFEYMPELKWKYGYFGVWGLMGVIFIALILYFRRKGWL
ncbi:magnesium/cobalt transporter CorA [Robiginitalea sp. SC105]|uniref:magnesium/cobalt transporter CorA n=1 Tax=Robiginitalea sp. SC105 TaxID=2762332 RepID=UPI0016398903|nr:magnesium/cobalt transporter CorA [Robiginitalea sp. SC105]MBC2840590.1 magnesium/cobalt transporter CorA [Robiginitalea sp. SC105]